VISTDQGDSGGFGCLSKLGETFIKKKYIFRFLLQSLNKLVIRQSQKKLQKKFKISF